MGHNTDLSPNNNVSKTVRVNGTFTSTFLNEYSISFLMIPKLIELLYNYASLLTDVYGNFGRSQKSQKLSFSIFVLLKGLRQLLLLFAFSVLVGLEFDFDGS